MIFRVINKIGRVSPDFISRLFIHIPFKFRNGTVYKKFENEIKEAEKWNDAERERYIVTHFDRIFQHAKKFRLYRDKYKENGVLHLVVKNIEDIQKIPVLNKNEIRDSISEFKGHYLEETGGTTGNPLHLYLNKDAWSKEWAHFHNIWGKVGYKYTDAKFVLRNQNSDVKFIKYNFQQNEYVINTYKLTNSKIDEFFKALRIQNIKYLHGYPSTINDFLKELEKKISKDQKKVLQQQIKCCFYSSEFPVPHIVEYLRKVWGLDFISWYGHSEQCVFAAADKNKLEYLPFHTYGFVEVEDNKLLGTSYHNFDMPLIRYDTGDLVKPKKDKNGILKSFVIKEGRIFDFIYDKNNLKINLVTFLRTKGSEIYSYVDYIQVYQAKKGFATIIAISQDIISNQQISTLMSLEDIQIEFDFIHLKKPIRTISGKVGLRVNKIPVMD